MAITERGYTGPKHPRQRYPVPALRAFRYRLFAILAVLGPGFITANVDNDPGGILTYSNAGAKYGYMLLWTLIPTTVALIVVQEMAARMGAITGKGLSDLIREEFGLRMTFFTMIVLGLADFGNIAAEFAGLASGLGMFGVSKYIAVPIGAALVWLVIVRGSYKPVEKVLLVFSLIYFTYIVSAILGHPDWKQAIHNTLVPQFSRDPGYVVMIVGLIGTTITPWMQFYLQASVVEKGISKRNYNLCRLDVILGCIMTDVIAFFIIVCCAGAIYSVQPRDIQDAKDAAQALRPFGNAAFFLFSAGLFNASIFAASILPLSTAYSVCEGLGFEAGVNRRMREAPVFYALYTGLIVAGSAVILIPGFPLVRMILLSQVLNGVLLPFILIFMVLLINRRDLMGEWVNPRWFNLTTWATVAVMIGLTLALVGITVRGF